MEFSPHFLFHLLLSSLTSLFLDHPRQTDRQTDRFLSAGLCRPKWIHPSRVICNILLLPSLQTLLIPRPNDDGDETELLVTRVIPAAFGATGPFLVRVACAVMSIASLRENDENEVVSHVPDNNQLRLRRKPLILPLARPWPHLRQKQPRRQPRMHPHLQPFTTDHLPRMAYQLPVSMGDGRRLMPIRPQTQRDIEEVLWKNGCLRPICHHNRMSY